MIRVFEAFAGYGSQSIALDNIGVDYEVVATSEIDIDAIIGYCALRGEIPNAMTLPSHMIKYLEDRNIGLDFNTGEVNIKKLPISKVRQLYSACITSKNLGDISKVKVEDIPDHDLFTYSFPCQSLSQAGLRSGMKEGSGTKSSLIWECKKVIKGKKPKYLLMENVVGLLSKSFREDFEAWCSWLEEQGYQNYYKVLNAEEYGIPQSRKRVIMISIKGNEPFFFPIGVYSDKTVADFLDMREDVGFPLSDTEMEALGDDYLGVTLGVASNPCSREFSGFKLVAPTLCARDFKGPKVCTYVLGTKRVIRRLTPLECCRLMGLKDGHYQAFVKAGLSNTAIYKLTGNSIVVPILEEVFKALFKK